MPKKYRRYQSGGPLDRPLGGIMGLADRVKKKVRRDVKRGSGVRRPIRGRIEDFPLTPPWTNIGEARKRGSDWDLPLIAQRAGQVIDPSPIIEDVDGEETIMPSIYRIPGHGQGRSRLKELGRNIMSAYDRLTGGYSTLRSPSDIETLEEELANRPSRRGTPRGYEGVNLDHVTYLDPNISGVTRQRRASGGIVGLRGGGQVRMVYNNGQLIPAYGFGDWIKKWGGKAAKGIMKVAPMAMDFLPFGGTAKSLIGGALRVGSGIAEGEDVGSAIGSGLETGMGEYFAEKAANDPEWGYKNYAKIRALEKLGMGHAGGAGGRPSPRPGVEYAEEGMPAISGSAAKGARAPSETITRLTGPAASKYNLFDELKGKARGGIIGLQEGGDVRQGQRVRELSREDMDEMNRRHRARYGGGAQRGGQDPWSRWQQQQPYDYRRQQQGQQGAVHPSQRPQQGPPQGQPAGGGGPAGAGTGGYRPQALPEGYGGPQAYAGYGMPAEMGVRQEFVSPEVASQYADIKEGIMQAGTRPWEDVRYKGPHLAGFTDMEAAYQAGIGALGTGQGPQGTRQAEATIGEAARGIGQAAAAAGTPELEREADLSQYMSQYTSGVTDPKLAKLREFQQEQAQELGSQAAGAGAFGGYRQGVMEGQQRQDVAQQAADIIGADQEAAFKSAQAAFARDVATGAGARGQQMDAYGQLLGAGGQQAALGGQQQAEEMARLDAMRRAGMSQRELQQAGLDVAKEQHELGVQHPEKQLSWMTGMLGQLPYQNIVQQAGYKPQMGPASTMMGAGIAGAGMAAGWRGGQPSPQGRFPQQPYPQTGTQPTGFTPPSFDTNIYQPGQMGSFGQFGSQGGGGQPPAGGGLPAGGAFTPAGGLGMQPGAANVTQGTGGNLLGGAFGSANPLATPRYGGGIVNRMRR